MMLMHNTPIEISETLTNRSQYHNKYMQECYINLASYAKLCIWLIRCKIDKDQTEEKMVGRIIANLFVKEIKEKIEIDYKINKRAPLIWPRYINSH